MAAAFSPCLPNPRDAIFSLSIVICVVAVEPVFICDMKDGGTLLVIDEALKGGPIFVGMKLFFADSRHDMIHRLTLADSRKMRPTNTLRHPIENRKKADTRVKVST